MNRKVFRRQQVMRNLGDGASRKIDEESRIVASRGKHSEVASPWGSLASSIGWTFGVTAYWRIVCAE